MAARVDRPVLLDNTVLTNLALVDRCEMIIQTYITTSGGLLRTRTLAFVAVDLLAPAIRARRKEEALATEWTDE